MCFQAGSVRLLTGEPFCLQALRALFLPKVLPSRKLSWIEKVNKSSQNYFPVFQCVCALCWHVRGKHSRTLLVQKASKSAAFLEMCWARVCCCAGVFRLTFLFSSLTMYSLTKRAWIFSTIACWEREEGIIIHLSFAWGHNKPCVRMEEKTILAAVRRPTNACCWLHSRNSPGCQLPKTGYSTSWMLRISLCFNKYGNFQMLFPSGKSLKHRKDFHVLEE